MPTPPGKRLCSYVGASLGRKGFGPEDQCHLTEEVAYELGLQGMTPERVERALDTSKKSDRRRPTRKRPRGPKTVRQKVVRAIDVVAGPQPRERPLGDLDPSDGDCRRRNYLGNVGDPAEIVAGEDETLAAKKELLVLALKKELKTLPAWQREALALIVNGKSCREAADILHRSKSRINEAVREAKQILAARLERFRPEFEEASWGPAR